MVSPSDRPAAGLLTAAGRRALDGLLTAWAAVSVTFFALRLAGGDPVASLLAQGLASSEQAAALRHQLGLDLPLLQQYLRFLGGLLRGDLGRSLYTGQPVTRIIGEQIPYTAQLAAAGLFVALGLGLVLGLLAAGEDRGRRFPVASGIAGIATALPVAFTGILAILAATRLGLASVSDPATLRSLGLPALVLGFASAGAVARLMQAGMQETLAAPFMLAARARGLRRGPRLLWHALRPALPPVVSLIAIEAAFLFGGTVVTETVFSRPGLGRLLVGSILQGDFPVAQGLVVLSALVYTLSHVAADTLGLILDPRLRRTE
ncbi:MAG: ABC transporter permease [Anaerolineales bacterium]|nr:ABC transporter permease [Anaerolineales bacterium]